MRAIIKPHAFTADLRIPASKSHTIRRLLFASLADGVSVLERPLDSLDARSCLDACRAFGAEISESDGGNGPIWTVKGLGIGTVANGNGYRALPTPDKVIDVGNSGTTLYLALAVAALGHGWTIFSGDEQIRRRSAANLLRSLGDLGVEAFSTRDNGCAPILVRGLFQGGRTSIECPTSQYLSALLIAAPLAPAGQRTEIDVPLLNEKPYAAMTLAYLNEQRVAYRAAPDWSYFEISGGARYQSASGPIPGDFSSAAFPACAAAISGGHVTLRGLDPADSQGDKAVFPMLERLGCEVAWRREDGEAVVTVDRRGELTGAVLDLNATPDALPALAAVACFVRGETRLVNVPNARIKETDRIAVMAQELRKLGARIDEAPDGLIIHGTGGLRGGMVESHGDHRVAMALATAALGADGDVGVEGAECAAVTYPAYLELLGL